MGYAVTFDYAKWVARYPEFAGVLEPAAQDYFDEATIYLRNDGGGPVPTAALQLLLLNMLTAHIAKIYATVNGIAPSGLVGAITNAAEGSVNVAVKVADVVPGTMAWFAQTPYGLSFWQATASFRTAVYRPSFSRIQPGVGPWWGR